MDYGTGMAENVPSMNDDAWNQVSLAGKLDVHVHTAPDTRPRWHSALEMAALADAAGMAGFVLKNHDQSTVALAREVRAQYPALLVRGGLVLNRSVGGVDPAACRAALADGARFIWLPTKDGCGERQSLGLDDGLGVIDGCGRITRALREVLEAIAAADAVLATGHVSASEVLPVVQAARAAGVRHVVVNHPEIPFLRFPVDLQARLRDEGAMLERCYPRPEAADGFDQIADEIRAVGVSSTVLATDLGRTDLPSPLAGFRRFIHEMLVRGFTAAELDCMTCSTPRRLVGPLR
jgi:hypothetical protein